MLPTIAIVGRPNVGKSTLFNRLLRKSLSITHDMPGVTRDRIYGEVQFQGVEYALVDTGGMVMESEATPVASKDFENEIFEQAREAIAEAHGIVFVVDGREGMNSLDEQAATFVRQSNKPVLLVVNKVDGEEQEAAMLGEFHHLGFEMMPVSCAHGYNLNVLRQAVADMAEAVELPEEVDDGIAKGLRLAMLGRPNAGKSSMINALIREDRLIVSDVAGTTRDSIDVTFEHGGKRYTFVDTAGVRRRTNILDAVEKFSVIRALRSSKKADMTILVLDAMEGLSRQDKRLLHFLVTEKTPFVLAVNKTDLIPKTELKAVREAYEMEMRIAPHVPILYTSNVTKSGLNRILPLAEKLVTECAVRAGTGELNRFIADAVTRHQPPVVKRKRPKFFYATQADDELPTFVFFVNDHTIIKPAYARYLENQLRKALDITMAPLNIVFRSSHEKRPKEKKRGITAMGMHGPGKKTASIEDHMKAAHKRRIGEGKPVPGRGEIDEELEGEDAPRFDGGKPEKKSSGKAGAPKDKSAPRKSGGGAGKQQKGKPASGKGGRKDDRKDRKAGAPRSKKDTTGRGRKK